MKPDTNQSQMSHRAPTGTLQLYTVGHSNLPTEGLISLLRGSGIETIVDVRTYPGSKRFPQYNRPNLEGSLTLAGLRYLWLGNKIGGKRTEPEFLTPDGQVDPDKVIASDIFQSGLRDLLDLAARARVAILCAEEDPYGCHRTYLICRGLRDRNVEILHIRRSGAVEPHRSDPEKDPQQTLFDL